MSLRPFAQHHFRLVIRQDPVPGALLTPVWAGAVRWGVLKWLSRSQPIRPRTDRSTPPRRRPAALGALRVQAFGAAGGLSGARLWAGLVTSDGAGAFSVDVSAAGFSTVLAAVSAARLSTETVTDRAWATLATVSTTTVTGYTLRGISLLVLGATIRTAPNVPVYVVVIGT